MRSVTLDSGKGFTTGNGRRFGNDYGSRLTEGVSGRRTESTGKTSFWGPRGRTEGGVTPEWG